MKLIIGLGNIGKEYDNTRHNVGFCFIDSYADKNNVQVTTKKFDALIGEFNNKGEKIILAKPTTYMNLSGEAVRQICNFYKIDIKDIIVIYDDLDLPVGKIRLRTKGSAGGHNGIKSIISNIKTEQFNRVKIGIDKNPLYKTADYVLGKFTKEQNKEIELVITKVEKAIDCWIEYGFDKAMNEYNK